MFDTVLVAHDGSDNAWRALKVGADVARRYEARLVVGHVREWMIPPMVMPSATLAGVELESEEAAAELEEHALKALAEEGVPATFEARRGMRGQVASTLLGLAEDTGTDLIVMGTRGMGDLKALVVGSVAHDVLHRGTLPVLIVR